MFSFVQDAFKLSKELSDGQTWVPISVQKSQVLNREQEEHVVQYAITIAQMFYGLPVQEFRRVVYSYAVACGSQAIPEAWEREKAATYDWYRAFMRRHPKLTLKAPEGMSIARITAFNRVNVDVFFKAYTSAVEKYGFQPHQIYNLDESALSTVMKPVKVVCARGRPVASQVSRERGATITFVGIINAMGQSVPPVFIIPRKHSNPAFMRGTSHGCKAILQPSGLMNGECFVEILQHLHEWTGSSVENKIVLIMDNAECHMNIHAVEYAIEHGIVIVTTPPHTTDKLQPLDVSVFGPFKTYLRAKLNGYALMNPHKHITEHMLPEFACDARSQACTIQNVLSGFKATGIWPINHKVFPDDAFLGAMVTECPNPQDPFIIEVQPPSDESDVPADEEPGNQSPLQSSVPQDDLAATSDGDDSHTPAVAENLAPAVTEEPVGLAGPSWMSDPAPVPVTSASPVGTSPPLVSPSSPASSTPPPPSRLKISSSFYSPQVCITPQVIRPYPKVERPPTQGKGRKRVHACILTEDENALADLRAKDEKKRKAEEKKKASAERKKASA